LVTAEQLRTEIFNERVRKSGPDSLNALLAATSLGQIQVQRGEFAQAEQLLRPAQQGWEKIALNPWRPALNQNYLAAALAGEGKFAEAEPLFRRSIETLEQSRDSIPPLEVRLIAEARERRDRAYRAAGKNPPDKS
jgi:tetratricopeptide (TPR) repeat protein